MNKLKKQQIEVVFENDDYVIINKPAPYLSVPDRYDKDLPNAFSHMVKKYDEIYLVHRLDKETSGLMAFAKNDAALSHISQLFENRSVSKKYHGIVEGTMTNDEGTIEGAIQAVPKKRGRYEVNKDGKESSTDYKVLEKFKLYSLVEFAPLTGRTHQIRVHAAYIGYPILADKFYGYSDSFKLSSIKRKKFNLKREDTERPLLTRHALHAYSLEFQDQKGITIKAEAPIPKDMKACLHQMRKLIKLA